MNAYFSASKKFCFSRTSGMVLILSTILTTLLIFLIPPILDGGNSTVHQTSKEYPCNFPEAEVQPGSNLPDQQNHFYLGRVEARRTSDLGFERDGMLKSVYAYNGDPVIAGQILAKLDTKRLEAEQKEAEALLAEAKIGLIKAQVLLSQNKTAKQEHPSTSKIQLLQNDLNSQWAKVVSLEAQLERISIEIGKSKLYAPYNGTLSERFQDEGSLVKAGVSILKIVETGHPEIHIGLSDTTVKEIQPGVIVHGKVGGKEVPLRINRFVPAKDKNHNIVEAIAVPTNSDINLHVNDRVEVNIDGNVKISNTCLPVSTLTLVNHDFTSHSKNVSDITPAFWKDKLLLAINQ